MVYFRVLMKHLNVAGHETELKPVPIKFEVRNLKTSSFSEVDCTSFQFICHHVSGTRFVPLPFHMVVAPFNKSSALRRKHPGARLHLFVSKLNIFDRGFKLSNSLLIGINDSSAPNSCLLCM